jgi:hypothetical protein
VFFAFFLFSIATTRGKNIPTNEWMNENVFNT